MTEHTKEPKVVPCIKHCYNGHIGMDNCNVCGITGSQFLANGKRFPNTEKGYNDAVAELKDRAYACVNALAGIDDPEAFMRDVRMMIEAIDEGHINTGIMFAAAIDKHLKGGDA